MNANSNNEIMNASANNKSANAAGSIAILGVQGEQEGRRLAGVYLHGSLEDEAGFDLVVATAYDESKFAQTASGLEVDAQDGFFPVSVVGHDGPCTLAFWHHKRFGWPVGLVIANEDNEALLWALKKYTAREGC